MTSTVTFLAGVLASISMAVAGFAINNQQALSTRLATVESSTAVQAQRNDDIDARLTRIENKIDALGSNNLSKSNGTRN